MRILLLGLSLSPESGGGYTFAQDVFEALMRTEGHQHQFYVIDSGRLPPSSAEDVFPNPGFPQCFYPLLKLGHSQGYTWRQAAHRTRRTSSGFPQGKEG